MDDVIVSITDANSFLFWHLPDELFGLVYSFLDIFNIVQHEAVSSQWRNRLKSVPVSNAIWYRICSKLLKHQHLHSYVEPIDWKAAFRSLVRFEASDWCRYSTGHIVHHTNREKCLLSSRSKISYSQVYRGNLPPNTAFNAFRIGQNLVFDYVYQQTDYSQIAIIDLFQPRITGPFLVKDLSISFLASIGTNFESCSLIPLSRLYVSSDYILNQIGFFSAETLMRISQYRREFRPLHTINLINRRETLESYAYDRLLISRRSELYVWDLPACGRPASKILTLPWEQSAASKCALTKEYVIVCSQPRSSPGRTKANVFSINSGELLNAIEIDATRAFFTDDLIIFHKHSPIALSSGRSAGVKFDPFWVDEANLDITLDGSIMVSHDTDDDMFESTRVIDVYTGSVTCHKIDQHLQPGALLIYRKSEFSAARSVFISYPLHSFEEEVRDVPHLRWEETTTVSTRLQIQILFALLCLALVASILILPLNASELYDSHFQLPMHDLFDTDCIAFNQMGARQRDVTILNVTRLPDFDTVYFENCMSISTFS